MRSEIFRRIEENKKRFYCELNSTSTSVSQPSGCTIKPETMSSKTDTSYILDTLRSLKVMIAIPAGLLKLAKRVQKVRFSMPFPKIQSNSLVRLISDNLKQAQTKYNHATGKMADQVLYFILVFFGEESSAVEFALSGPKQNLQKLQGKLISGSLSFLILAGKLNRQNLITSKFRTAISPSINCMKYEFIRLIKTLSDALKVLENKFLKIIMTICHNDVSKRKANHSSYPRRL